MKYIGHYDRETETWMPEPLPRWFVVFLTIVTLISFVALVTLPGPVV